MDITGNIKGLHHVTATVDDAQEDYDFYVKLLGMRLVKETVNFDNEKVYHFYYANEIGLPSTVWTTFPYRGQEIRKGTIGTGQVYRTSFSVLSSALEFWKARLSNHNVAFQEVTRFGKQVLEFDDPSGLKMDITGVAKDEREPLWATDDVSKENAIVGIHSVTLLVKELAPTVEFLEAFGYQAIGTEGDLTLLRASSENPGDVIMLRADPDGERGLNGIGTVHHVAHRVASKKELLEVLDFVLEKGLKPTEVKDRKYFQSIYFRIPGGVLFEVATEEPGFMVDESREELGTALKLPEWQEPNRARIEANLLPYNK